MKKANSKAKYFYRYDRKGTRKVRDVLEVFPNRKSATFFNNCQESDEFFFKGHYLSYNGFNKKISSLVQKGYSIDNVEGVSSQVDPDRIREGLNGELPLELIQVRIRFRRKPDHYFDRKYIEKVKDLYLSNHRNDSYLSAWVLLYSHALQESIRHGDKKTNKIVLARCSCLSEFALSLKDGKKSGKSKNVDAAIKAIAQIDKAWTIDRKDKKDRLTKKLKQFSSLQSLGH